ncbi:hypothetical protein BpHYR1_019026 [Brachionus plicatilis]|uniref:Uncharacterized protein n=1 Tax=Brachionus plicatilis TaxID=10195 RepID=A0A3M7T4I2_BRAPC|nr:hypothetical protein BpHYR1_019026 [Brachionus plicatilis]
MDAKLVDTKTEYGPKLIEFFDIGRTPWSHGYNFEKKLLLKASMIKNKDTIIDKTSSGPEEVNNMIYMQYLV